jgi:hypothetical protein
MEISTLIAWNQTGSRFRATGRRFVDYSEGVCMKDACPGHPPHAQTARPHVKLIKHPLKATSGRLGLRGAPLIVTAQLEASPGRTHRPCIIRNGNYLVRRSNNKSSSAERPHHWAFALETIARQPSFQRRIHDYTSCSSQMIPASRRTSSCEAAERVPNRPFLQNLLPCDLEKMESGWRKTRIPGVSEVFSEIWNDCAN